MLMHGSSINKLFSNFFSWVRLSISSVAGFGSCLVSDLFFYTKSMKSNELMIHEYAKCLMLVQDIKYQQDPVQHVVWDFTLFLLFPG